MFFSFYFHQNETLSFHKEFKTLRRCVCGTGFDKVLVPVLPIIRSFLQLLYIFPRPFYEERRSVIIWAGVSFHLEQTPCSMCAIALTAYGWLSQIHATPAFTGELRFSVSKHWKYPLHLFSKTNWSEGILMTWELQVCAASLRSNKAMQMRHWIRETSFWQAKGCCCPRCLGSFWTFARDCKEVVCNQTSLRFNLFTSIGIFSNL